MWRRKVTVVAALFLAVICEGILYFSAERTVRDLHVESRTLRPVHVDDYFEKHGHPTFTATRVVLSGDHPVFFNLKPYDPATESSDLRGYTLLYPDLVSTEVLEGLLKMREFVPDSTTFSPRFRKSLNEMGTGLDYKPRRGEVAVLRVSDSEMIDREKVIRFRYFEIQD